MTLTHAELREELASGAPSTRALEAAVEVLARAVRTQATAAECRRRWLGARTSQNRAVMRDWETKADEHTRAALALLGGA